MGAHLVTRATRAFLPLLEGGSGKPVVNISSAAGSTSSTTKIGALVRSSNASTIGLHSTAVGTLVAVFFARLSAQ